MTTGDGRGREFGEVPERLIVGALPQIFGLQLHARYLPAGQPERVGGGWYDAHALAEGRVSASVGDVVGHPVSAALFMTRLRQAMRVSADQETSPGMILTAVNRTLLQAEDDELLLGTAVCCLIDPSSREIAYASAGHPPAVLVPPSGAAISLVQDGAMLGVEEYVYPTHVTRADPGSLSGVEVCRRCRKGARNVAIFRGGFDDRLEQAWIGARRRWRTPHLLVDGQGNLRHRRHHRRGFRRVGVRVVGCLIGRVYEGL
jgi:hypothetical protein